MRLVKLAEHLLKEIIELTVGGGTRYSGRIFFTDFIPVDAAEGWIEMLLLDGSPDNFERFAA